MEANKVFQTILLTDRKKLIVQDFTNKDNLQDRLTVLHVGHPVLFLNLIGIHCTGYQSTHFNAILY